MKLATIALVVVALAVLGGCGSAPTDDGAIRPGSGKVLNPGGKPQNAQQAAYAAEMQKTGQAMNAAMQRGAADMAAAKARAGAK